MFTQRKEQLKPKDIAHAEAVKRELGNLDLDACPTCDECGEPYSPRRRDLGYFTCLDCGSPAKTYAIVPVPKSSYTIASNLDQLKNPYGVK